MASAVCHTWVARHYFFVRKKLNVTIHRRVVSRRISRSLVVAILVTISIFKTGGGIFICLFQMSTIFMIVIF